jgi:ketosteroid isomerase-like protein
MQPSRAKMLMDFQRSRRKIGGLSEEAAMPEPALRQRVMDFYVAMNTRDPARIGDWLTDDVDWFIFAPVEVFPMAGHRRGREAVVQRFRELPKTMDVRKYEHDAILVDGDSAATLNRITYVQVSTGRTIRYRIAQFLRFRDGKVCEFRAIIDSLDAAEQYLGRALIAPAA